MIQAILLDSDGVLVDTERLYFEATREAFAAAGVLLSRKQWARWYLGESRSSLEIGQLLGLSTAKAAAAVTRRNNDFWGRIDRGAPLLPGVRETLDRLVRHYRLAVVTGATRPHFERVHASTGLGSVFEIVVTRDDCQKAKPSPEAHVIAMEKLAVAPEHCLAVEDSPRGAAAAVAAGVACCIIPTPLTDMRLCPSECRMLAHFGQLSEVAETWEVKNESIATII